MFICALLLGYAGPLPGHGNTTFQTHFSESPKLTDAIYLKVINGHFRQLALSPAKFSNV